MSAPFIDDPDFTLWVGDVRETLARRLESGSVDCVITSPPYWGLRDYGTGLWDGGDPDCDHLAPLGGGFRASTLTHGPGKPLSVDETEQVVRNRQKQYGASCGKCGATRQDQQLGLESTPDEYVRNMVAVFREVRRLLAPHGTCWVNLGDSYAGGNFRSGENQDDLSAKQRSNSGTAARLGVTREIPAGLKHKDLVGIPWRIAFALQADGWYLRSDIVWSKPNPMPESVTDRPTKAHEYVFLLTKQPRYWFDAEAVREPHVVAPADRRQRSSNGYDASIHTGRHEYLQKRDGNDRAYPASGRNVRSVWEIATQPYPEAHFATYPEELVRRCLLAGCPEWVCRTCGVPRTRIVEQAPTPPEAFSPSQPSALVRKLGATSRLTVPGAREHLVPAPQTLGFSDCGHGDYRPGVVLDPFLGSGTTALVARRHGRACVGIELNPTYAELAAKRLQQLSLLAEGAA